MKISIPEAGRTLDDINEHSKIVAWCCYAIVNICVNCIPNILLLKGRKIIILLQMKFCFV
jgi:hypothetical protein